MTQETTKKPSPWQRFKNLSIIKKIGLTVGTAFLLMIGLVIVISVADPEGLDEIRERQAQEREDRASEREAEAEREAQEQAKEEAEAEAERIAEEEAEAERLAEEESEAEAEAERIAEAEAEAEEVARSPEGITGVRDFEDADVSAFEGSVRVDVEVGPGWSESSMCQSIREQTIRGLQFFRDSVEDEYEQVGFSYFTRSEEDATGDSSILPMAGVYYDYETVQAIQDESVTIQNVWQAADEGGEALVCQRAG